MNGIQKVDNLILRTAIYFEDVFSILFTPTTLTPLSIERRRASIKRLNIE
jgi:hypothetical protein